MVYEEGLTKLQSRAGLAKGVLWLFVALAAADTLGETLKAMGAVDLAVDPGPLALAVALVAIVFSATLLGSVVVVAMWIYRAHANLHEAGIVGLEFTPNWAVGWYFIPFANLVKPFEAMRELWAASHAELDRMGGPAPSIVKLWWGAWLSGTILRGVGGQVLTRGESSADSAAAGDTLIAAGTAVMILAAILLTRLISGVTAAQRSGATAATVFA